MGLTHDPGQHTHTPLLRTRVCIKQHSECVTSSFYLQYGALYFALHDEPPKTRRRGEQPYSCRVEGRRAPGTALPAVSITECHLWGVLCPSPSKAGPQLTSSTWLSSPPLAQLCPLQCRRQRLWASPVNALLCSRMSWVCQPRWSPALAALQGLGNHEGRTPRFVVSRPRTHPLRWQSARQGCYHSTTSAGLAWTRRPPRMRSSRRRPSRACRSRSSRAAPHRRQAPIRSRRCAARSACPEAM